MTGFRRCYNGRAAASGKERIKREENCYSGLCSVGTRIPQSLGIGTCFDNRQLGLLGFPLILTDQHPCPLFTHMPKFIGRTGPVRNPKGILV
jgi:hypothetical protein